MARYAASAGGLSERTLSTTSSHDAQQLLGHGARCGLGVATAAEVVMGHDVAHRGHARVAADHVRARRGHEPAGHADAVVDPIGDRVGRQPAGEAQVRRAG